MKAGSEKTSYVKAGSEKNKLREGILWKDKLREGRLWKDKHLKLLKQTGAKIRPGMYSHPPLAKGYLLRALLEAGSRGQHQQNRGQTNSRYP